MEDRKNLDFLDQFEIGGNFFELIEFSLTRKVADGRTYQGTYGVNVAKVREVVHMPKINPLASSLEGVAGVFELRGIPIPAVNLTQILGDGHSPINQDHQIIVTEFSQKRAGFIVNQTHRIRRVSWDKVLPPSTDASSCMTGMILLEDRDFLFILDLEKILVGLESSNKPDLPSYPYNGGGAPTPMLQRRSINIDPSAPGILVVDDSKLILNNLTKILSDEGYRTITANNGQEALKIIESILEGQRNGFGEINAIITDIEMPKMDGLTFIKTIRQNPALKQIPILLHTSLDGVATKEAAKKVGANGYVIKNDIIKMVQKLEDFFSHDKVAIG